MANLVEYRQLGNSGLRVSVPIVGAMSYGSPEWLPWVLDEEQSLPILKAAWDRGINTIDTANVYSNGESEKIIAKFIEQFNIPRNQIIILTKCYALVGSTPGLQTFSKPELRNQREYVNQSGLSRAAICNAVDASLQRLKTPYIDLLQIHRFDQMVPVEETMKALHDLVQSGKVRYIGASSMRCWQFAHMNEVAEKHGWTKFVSMQNEYSLLYREEEREMNAYCKYNGIGLIPWAPVAAGSLCRPVDANTTDRAESRKDYPPSQLSDVDKFIIGRVEELAKRKGWTMTQVALTWVKMKVSSLIVGMSSVQRVEDNIVNGLTLTEEDTRYLEELYAPKPVRGHQ
ncbi:NADP-dependent oxidoreductase domain-containing protein [Lentinula aff. lateritia]|uniref:NADP-dependent oxidoreductase domain-containing protein n=1 Tax=Lentinula aff. lateritia TaxID=2804960 RepID=A0ACC1TKJ6_9AGAR|nr:NADP-dependent oxidoreductase domain-containing protein [Lentinula aff. lateritia]